MQQFKLKEFLKRQGISATHTTVTLWNALNTYTTDDTWLAGGSVMSLIRGYKHTADYDFFFGSQNSLDHFYANLRELGAAETFRTDNAVTVDYGGAKLQLIGRKFYASAQEIIDDFDLTISMFVIGLDNLYCGDYSLMDLSNKELRVEHVNSLGHTFKRLFKYGKKGFHMTPQSYTKMMEFFTVNPTLDAQITQAAQTVGSGVFIANNSAGGVREFSPDQLGTNDIIGLVAATSAFVQAAAVVNTTNTSNLDYPF